MIAKSAALAPDVKLGAVVIVGVVMLKALLAFTLYVISTATSSAFQSALVFASPVTAKEPTVAVTLVGSLVNVLPAVESLVVGPAISTESREPYFVIAVVLAGESYFASVVTAYWLKSNFFSESNAAVPPSLTPITAAVPASERFKLILFFVEVASAVKVLYSVTTSLPLDFIDALTVTLTGIATSASASTDAFKTSILLDATVNLLTVSSPESAIGLTLISAFNGTLMVSAGE